MKKIKKLSLKNVVRPLSPTRLDSVRGGGSLGYGFGADWSGNACYCHGSYVGNSAEACDDYPCC